MSSVLIAYSGGVDSTFLLKVAVDTLGKDNVLAVTADSETYPRQELAFARSVARKFGVQHIVIRTDELRNPRFSANPQDRCYYCKRELFSKLKRIAREKNIQYVLDASQASDKNDFRPGGKAVQELGICSPLKEAGFTKEEIRALSKKYKLPTWNMPSKACLASRFPYGHAITAQGLRRVEKAEKILQDLGFAQNRVRTYGDLCRIEVEKNNIPKLMRALDESSLRKLKSLGYIYVTVDMQGYRTGSLNEGLTR